MREPQELFTVIDIETTGLDHNREQIIEIAAIQTNLTEEVGRLHLMVQLRKGKKLPDEIKELTGISEDDLVDAFPEEVAAVMLSMFAAGTTVVAHHAAFDLSFLDKHGFRPPFFLCTRSMAKLENPEESASLKDVCERFGIELKGHHRAMNDAEATVAVLKALLPRLKEKGFKRSDYHNLVIDSEERPLTFIPRFSQIKSM